MKIFRPRRLGIILMNGAVHAAFAKGKSGPANLVSVASEGPLFTPFDQTALEGLLGALASNLPKSAKRLDVAAHLALPDLLVSEDFLEFTDFPEKKEEAQMLVEARLAREHAHLNEPRFDSYQLLASAPGRYIVLARSMNLTLRDALDAAMSNAGFRVTHMEATNTYAERSHEKPEQAGAFIWVTGETWSVECAEPAKNRYFTQAGWIEDWQVDARLILRLVQSFRLAGALNALPVTISGEGQFAAKLETLLCDAGLVVANQAVSNWLDALARRITR